MTRTQRYRYEMFVRVRDFGTAQASLFPESSKGGQTFARVAEAVAAIDEHLKDHVIGKAEAGRVKAATRDAVFEYMKTLAQTGRRVTKAEAGAHAFRLPVHRSLRAEIATARAFIEQAEARQHEFIQFGLPATFIADFRELVDKLQQASEVRLSSKTVRRQALAGVETTLREGLEAIRDLDALVAVATRQDPATFAAWTAARRIEGQSSTAPSPGGAAKAVKTGSPQADGETTPGVVPATGADAAPVRPADVLVKAS